MAGGSFNNGHTKVYLRIDWSSTAGNGGSSVSASLYACNESGTYMRATINQGFSITINGDTRSGNNVALSGSRGGTAGLIGHSVWVGYTGDKTINISGYANMSNIHHSTAGSLGEQSVGSNVALDKIGSAPTMGSVTAPSTSIVSETTTSITVKWNKASSYNGSCTYAIGCSKNGGAYSWVYPSNNINTTSYTWNIGTPNQGDTYKFAVCCANDISTSSYKYSGTVTINKLNTPTIGEIPANFNPYVSETFTIPLSGGSQSNNDAFMRRADVFMTDANGNEKKWYCSNPSNGNTSISVTVPKTDVINALGNKRYSAEIKVIAWIQNANGSRSSYVTKATTVNINTDGGATPTLGAPTISGGALGYAASCFITDVSTVNISSPDASLRRAPSGTTISYKIACTGVSAQNGQSAKFSSLNAGIKTITVTATDSRGLATTASKQIRVQAYSAPTIRNYTVTRLDNPQTSVKLAYTLNYSPIYSYKNGVNTQGDQLNTINTQQYSKDNSTWTTASNGCTITGLSTELVYTIYLRCSDKVRTTTYTSTSYKVPTIKTNMAIRRHGVGINCVPQTSYALEVSGNAKITEGLTVNGRMQTNELVINDKIQYSHDINSNGNTDAYFKLCQIKINSDHVNCPIEICYFQRGSQTTTKLNILFNSINANDPSLNKFTYFGYCRGAYIVKASTSTWDIYVKKSEPWDTIGFVYWSCKNSNIALNVIGSNEAKLPDGYTRAINFEADMMFPVGAVYITYNNNNPSNFLGGTWVQFGQGRVLMGEGTGNDGSTSMSFTASSSNGEYKHKLTTNEMPAHNHSLYRPAWTNAEYKDGSTFFSARGWNAISTACTGYTNNTGGGQAHNNIPPYIVVYFWRRTV